MSNRVMAALDYLDAHPSGLMMRQKQHRPLGDIEAKYLPHHSIELPFHVLVDGPVVLSGTSRTNLSQDKSLDQILDEDREKLVVSAQRSKSASHHKNSNPSRPQTSLSSGSALLSRDTQRRSFRSGSHIPPTSASRTSTKKLTFTPPGVHVGPSDARDEVMEEIVNKPLTRTPSKSRGSPPTRSRTAGSAPALGQQNRVNVGGSRSVTSLSRSRTFHTRSRNSESDSPAAEVKPGPFKTVKVTGPDMWVISSSTPASYFNGDLNDQAGPTEKSVSAKSTWQDTANSVPHEEKKSPPRYERQLGAPPQFGPTQQWYSFAGGAKNKQKPVLTAFTDETDNKYYSIESGVSQKVAVLLEGSPGIRIGVNGHMVSQSMKIDKKQEKGESDSNSEISEEDQASDLSVKENSEREEGSEKSGIQDQQSHSSLDQSAEKVSVHTDEEEDKQYSLLRYLGVAKGDNPYVVDSSSDSSSTDVMSLLNNLRHSDKLKTSNTYNEQEEGLWKILEGASPTLWMSKERWKTTQAIATMKKEMASKIEDNLGPLSWQDQLKQDDGKILKPSTKINGENKNMHKDRIPVVFNKLIDYEKFPSNFVHLTKNGLQPHSTVASVDKDLDLSPPSKGFTRTVSALPKTSKSLTSKDDIMNRFSLPQRPYTSQSRVRHEESTNEISPTPTDIGVSHIKTIPTNSHPTNVASEEMNGRVADTKTDDVSKEELDAIRLEAERKMKMTGGTLEETKLIAQHEDLKMNSEKNKSEKFLPSDGVSFRRSVTEKSVTLNSLPVKAGGTLATVEISSFKQKSPKLVNSLNLSEDCESYRVLNGPTPTPAHSARDPIQINTNVNEVSSKEVLPNTGHDPPLNTPKSPVSYHYYKEDVIPSSPVYPDQQHSAASIGSRYFSDQTTSKKMKRGSKSASFPSRTTSVSPRSNVTSLTQNISRQAQNHRLEGVSDSSPGSKTPNKHHNKFFGGALKVNKIGKPIMQSSIIPHGNTYADVITKSGYIQISQPIPISSQQRAASAAVGGSGNKVYDSYMRELSTKSARSSHDGENAAEKSNSLTGKRLGGSSTKLLPEYFRRPRQGGVALARMKGGHSGFAVQTGRRSGLAITSEQARSNNANMALDSSDRIGLGLHGGQLRLNLDKNIHIIYRDLGIAKKSSKPSSVVLSRQHSRNSNKSQTEKHDVRSVGQRSDSSMSRVPSAKSEKRSISEITTARELNRESPSQQTDEKMDSLRINLSDRSEEKENHSSVQAKAESHEVHNNITPLQARNSSAKSRASSKGLIGSVTDSGTQWSPHPFESPKMAKNNTITEPDIKSNSDHETSDKTEQGVEINGEISNGTENTDIPSTDMISENDINKQEESDESKTEVIIDDVSGQSSKKAPSSAKHKRSASDSHALSKEKDPGNADDEIDVRGVTKVTVNIATA